MNVRSFVLVVCAVTACSMTVACDKKGDGASPAASGSAPTAKAAACPAGQLAMDGPGICLAVPTGYTPLNSANAKEPGGGSMQVNYSSDGTSGGKFVATLQVTYNAASTSPPNFKALEDDAKQYCDAPPKIEDIAGGKGKYFQCMSKKLDGHSYAKSKIFSAKNVIDCSSQSEKKPEVDTACKTLKQL
jgi:hypothetical protein